MKHTIANLQQVGKAVELCWIPDTQVFQEIKSQIRKPKKHDSTYQDPFPYFNDALHENSNAKWNEKDDKLKEIKPETRLRKENNRCRRDETVIHRLSVSCATVMQ